MNYAIDVQATLIRLTGTGHVTEDDLRQCVSNLHSDPDLPSDMDGLSDMCGITVDFTAEGVNAMIEIEVIPSAAL